MNSKRLWKDNFLDYIAFTITFLQDRDLNLKLATLRSIWNKWRKNYHQWLHPTIGENHVPSLLRWPLPELWPFGWPLKLNFRQKKDTAPHKSNIRPGNIPNTQNISCSRNIPWVRFHNRKILAKCTCSQLRHKLLHCNLGVWNWH